ncbi:metallopeptidase family protein [Xylanimonas protaetiae]
MGIFGSSRGSGPAPRPHGHSRRLRTGAAPAPEVGDPVATTGADLPPAPPRRRDRRGRGLRGPLMPATLPAHRTRADQFDDLVLDAVDDLERTWARQLAGTEFAVEDVPPSDPAPWEDGGVPLGRCFPAESGQPARVVVYRRPVELRAEDEDDLADLVHDVVVEQVAHLLARTPEEIDPGFEGR